MRSVNLIPTARRDAKRRRAHLRRCAAGLAAYAAVLAGACAAVHVLWDRHDASLPARVATLEKEIEAGEREAAGVRTELAAVRSALKANQAVRGQPDWSLLLALLGRQTGDDVVLRSCEVGPAVGTKAVPAAGLPAATAVAPAAVVAGTGGAAGAAGAAGASRVRIGGLARSPLAVSEFVLRLERTGLFAVVSLVDTNREPFLGAEASGFEIECSLANGAGPANPGGPQQLGASLGASPQARAAAGGTEAIR